MSTETETNETGARPNAKGLWPSAKLLMGGLRESLSYTRRTLALVYAASRGLTLALAVLTVIGAAVPPLIALAGKQIVDAIVAGSRADAIEWVLVELGLVVAHATTTRGLVLVRSVLSSMLGADINVRILERATRLDLHHFEDSELYDRMTRARLEATTRPVSIVTEAFSLAQNALTLLGYAALLLQFSSWFVALVVVATIPATISEMKYSKTAFRIRNWRSQDARRLVYFEHILGSDEFVKEVKLFGLGPMFLGRYKALATNFHREDSRLATKRAVATHLLSLLATMSFYGAYVVMAISAVAGVLTLGAMTMYVLAFRSGQQAFQSILTEIGAIYEHNLYMSNLFAFFDETEWVLPRKSSEDGTSVSKTKAAKLSQSGAHVRGIHLENVGFRYPNQDKWIFRNLNLYIPPGQNVALVGQNGAGKTTLVKLVSGLYQPTEGRILLDGRDVREWPQEALLSRFAVVFQDFNAYHLTLRENVGVGSVEHIEEAQRVLRAVERGGADVVLTELPSGMETTLGVVFEDGVQLSGGQWQKIAISRGFMREEADILVLDEPTAALDAEAERSVFERFRELSAGKTSFIISHRFPTVRLSDRILVLENGRVTEDGPHAALVASGRTYARLYNMQAEGYAC